MGDVMQKSIQRGAYVVLIVLLYGVTSGGLGAL
jgi:hypothetical protein